MADVKLKKVANIVLNNFKNDSRVLKQSMSLVKTGFNVKVVALHEEPLALGETIGNVSVERIKLSSRSWSKNKIVQLIKYVEFIGRVSWKYRKYDIFQCNDLSALPIGVITKFLFNDDLKIVYDAHEYEINDGPNQPKWLIRVKYWLESSLIHFADKVITVSESIAQEYVRLYEIPKPALVLNCPRFQKIEKKNIFRDRFSISEDKIIFIYQGALVRGRGIELLLSTFSHLAEEKFVLICMGYGVLESSIREIASKYKNIYFHEAVGPQVLLDFTSSADFGISFIEDTCLSYRYCLPNKMFEYLMAGLPVITSNLVEMRRFVEKYKIGVVAAANTEDGLRHAVCQVPMLDKELLGKRIREVQELYNWEQQERAYLEIYLNLQ